MHKHTHVHTHNRQIHISECGEVTFYLTFYFSDLDEKYKKRDRYTGMLTDFKEKHGYKPDVKLEYADETGRQLNQKEAFRQLSHRFHGKGSGKKKTEKRGKKLEEEHVSTMSRVLILLKLLSVVVDL